MILGYDSETYPIRPGRQSPRMVCASFSTGLLLERARAVPVMREILRRRDVVLAIHNAAFDMASLGATAPELWPDILLAYEDGRIECTKVRERLARIARGDKDEGLSLADLERQYEIDVGHKLGANGQKDEPWRLRYHELDGLRAEDYPEDARRYAIADARAHLLVHQAQEPAEVDQHRQARADLVLYVTGARGMRVDGNAIAALRRVLERRISKAGEALRLAGLLRANGTKNKKAAQERVRAVCELRNHAIPLTEKGQISTSKDAIEGLKDDTLAAFVEYTSADKTRNRLGRLELAHKLGVGVNARYNVLKETGRTSASAGERKRRPGEPILAVGDAVQNLDRAPGLREGYVGRPDHYLISCDYASGELHTLAQVCIDMGLDSNLARLLNKGLDMPTTLACEVNGWDYDWARAALKGKHGAEAHDKAKLARQGSKGIVYGSNGGMGARKLRTYTWTTYKVDLTDQEAERLKGAWFSLVPELRSFFAIVERVVNSGEPQVMFRSMRRRAGVWFTNCANGFFQGPLADIAKHAGWLIIRAGLHPWVMAHDEYILESEVPKADREARLASKLMEDAGRIWCPDCPPKAPPALSRRWRKGAELVLRDGIMIPWEDREPSEGEIAAARSRFANGESVDEINWALGFENATVKAMLA